MYCISLGQSKINKFKPLNISKSRSLHFQFAKPILKKKIRSHSLSHRFDFNIEKTINHQIKNLSIRRKSCCCSECGYIGLFQFQCMNDGPKQVHKMLTKFDPTDLVEVRKCSIKTKQLDVVNKLRSFQSLQRLDKLTEKDESMKAQTLGVLHNQKENQKKFSSRQLRLLENLLQTRSSRHLPSDADYSSPKSNLQILPSPPSIAKSLIQPYDFSHNELTLRVKTDISYTQKKESPKKLQISGQTKQNKQNPISKIFNSSTITNRNTTQRLKRLLSQTIKPNKLSNKK